MTPPNEEYRTIPLTQGQVCIVSADDYAYLTQFKWHAQRERRGNFYAASRSAGRVYFMHRLVCQTPEGMITDHINRDTLDNRRSNLRIADAYLNQQNRRLSRNNTSGFNGVFRRRNRWLYSVMRNRVILKGYGFATPEEASEALKKRAPTEAGA